MTPRCLSRPKLFYEFLNTLGRPKSAKPDKVLLKDCINCLEANLL